MAGELSTRFLFKQYAGISGTGDDALIDSLLTNVSAAMASFCGRTFAATEYRSWLDGEGTNTITLPQYPVTNLYRMATGLETAAEITHTGGTTATVSCHGGVLYLDDVATNGTENHNTATLDTYPIISDLATQVATITGWTLTAQSTFSTANSRDIRDIYGEWCLSPDDVDLDVPDEGEAVRLVPESNQTIERPGSTVFPCGHANIYVHYKAGYTLPVDNTGHSALTTAGNVPGDLTLMCNEMVKQVLYTSKQKVGALESEKTQTYAYKVRTGALAAVQEALKSQALALSMHCSMRVA